MKHLRFLPFLSALSLAFLPSAKAATGDVHVLIVGANGQVNDIVLPAPTTAGTFYQDGNGNYSFVPVPTIPTNIPVLTDFDLTVTTAGLTAGTGTLLGKFTMPITWTTAFATGVVPKVFVNCHGLCTYGDVINITNTGGTLVLPLSVAGTFTILAVKPQ